MYNVGSGVFKPFTDTSYEEFESSWRAGPAGIFAWTKATLPLLTSGSSIGITGATASWRGMPFTPAFGSSKMETRALSHWFARILGPSRGIHVFHVVIDRTVDLDPVKRRAEGTKSDHAVLDPNAVAETFWQLHRQPPNCWTQETHIAA